jgi:uncharacterized membrane protein YkvA (DUF1232 family)
VLAGWKAKVDALKRDVTAVALAARDPRTPWVARLLVLAIVAYAVSPIDLIPDFIPVLGLLDELLLLPLALLAAVRMIPVDVMRDAREQANDQRLAPSWAAALLIVLIWLAVVAWLAHLALPLLVG